MTTQIPDQSVDTAEIRSTSSVCSKAIGVAWFANVAALLLTVAWLYSSGDSATSPAEFWSRLNAVNASQRWTARTVLAVTAVSGCLIVGSLLAGPRHWRRLKYWLVAVGLVGCWCGLLKLWPDVYWQGQQARLRGWTSQATQLAQSLHDNWPEEDGHTPELGAYLAYPKSAPTTLFLLGQRTLPGTSIQFSCIERTPDQAIRFQLTGAEQGAWLEWRSDGSAPESFVGGLQTQHDLLRQDRLDSNWFLVRYAAAAALGEPASSD